MNMSVNPEFDVNSLPVTWGMTTSPSIQHIAKVMPALQAEIPSPVRNKQSDYGKYADLAEIHRVIKPPMAKYGFSLSSFPYCDGERAFLTTKLLHESGEFFIGFASCPLPQSDFVILKKDSLDVVFHQKFFQAGYGLSKSVKSRIFDQGLSSEMNIPIQNNFSPSRPWGSVVTYLRRTSICCLLNLYADEAADDDGYIGDEPVIARPPATPAREVTEEDRKRAIEAIKSARTPEQAQAAGSHALSLSQVKGWQDFVESTVRAVVRAVSV